MNTNQQWNQGQMPTGGNPQMQPQKDGGRKGLIIAISIVSVLVLALGGFIAYKLWIEKKGASEVTAEVAADSLKKATVGDADSLSKALKTGNGEDAYGKGGDEMRGLPDAVVLGFDEGVKNVEFGFEAGYGYTYHFNLNGQLVSVDYFDHGTELKLYMLNGKATECSGQDNGFGDDEPEDPTPFHSVFEYQQNGEETVVYRSVDGQKEEKMGSIYYGLDEPDRIVRIDQDGKTVLFTYDSEGRAFTKKGVEVYPPLYLFFGEEAPLLPKKHKVRRADGNGRPLLVDAYDDTQHYTITYFD